MRKTVFLDRDGTINVDKGYVYKIEDFEFIDGATDGLRLLSNAGYQLVIITNQSGIARGYYKEEDYQQLDKWMCNKLAEEGIIIAGSYYCPHMPTGVIAKYSFECNCRKPKPGLFIKAMKELDVDEKNSYVIGDNLRDVAVCEGRELKGILLGDNYKVQYGTSGIIIMNNLLDAAKYIVNNNMPEFSQNVILK